MIVKVQCPYCKEEKSVDIDTGLNLVDCYPEDGGCDQTFVIKLKLTPIVETFSLQPYTPNLNKDGEPTDYDESFMDYVVNGPPATYLSK